ncbi:Zn(2)-C6 fungal-type domain-containing protein [Fusarium sp. LHS14.1]|nr:Zn(2)-C6 fungal-type domain-containing protein [Fusarium sp. LHS14.1]
MFPFRNNGPDVFEQGEARPNRRSATREPRLLPQLVQTDHFPRPAHHVNPVDPSPLDLQQHFTGLSFPDPLAGGFGALLGAGISTYADPSPGTTIPPEQVHSDDDPNQQTELGQLMIPRKRQRNDTSGRESKRAKTVTLAAATGNLPEGPCDFCRNHRVGQTMYAQDGRCTIEIVQGSGRDVYHLECQHCADFRSSNPKRNKSHMCVINENDEYEYTRYGQNAPEEYPDRSECTRCVKFGFEKTCDADTILGYKCSNCRSDYACNAAGWVLPLKRPNKLAPLQPWYRHACDRCRAHAIEDGRLQDFEMCSWLENRSEWEDDKACSRCIREGMSCMDSTNLVQDHPDVKPPQDWSIDEGYNIIWDVADLARTANWRKPCDACILSNVKCQVHLARAGHACERCSQIGVGCVSDYGTERTYWRRTYWPLYSLSLVGFGPHMPFAACKNCRVNDRACDRQRPCDSCVLNGEKTECDEHQRLKKQNTLPRPEVGNLGPLYYLAMGFGADGVTSVKKGAGPEDWIGPLTPRYAVDNFENDGLERYKMIIDAHRNFRPPVPAKPPHGAHGGQLLDKQNMGTIKQSELQKMIYEMWPGYQNPCEFEGYRNLVLQLENELPENPSVQTASFDAWFNSGSSRSRPTTSAGRDRRPVGEPVNPPKQPACERRGWRPPTIRPPKNKQYTYSNEQSAYGSQPDVEADLAQRRSRQLSERQLRAERRQRRYDEDTFGRSMKPTVGISSPPEAPANARLVMAHRKTIPSGRAPQDATAAEEAPFNPFLGFTMKGKTKVRYKTKSSNSRWKVFNPLEHLNMSHWHVARHHQDSRKTHPRVFNMAEGQKLPVPLRDVLCDVPREEAEQRIIERCVEPNDGGFGYCSRENSFRINCQSRAHSNTSPYKFPVCNQCHVASINDLFREGNRPITKKDLVGMRAYLCHDCAGHISSRALNVLDFHDAGARTVHGTYANYDAPKGIFSMDDDPENAVEFRRNPKPGTGCFCADKVLGGWLCRYHRLYYAEEMLKQSKLVHEWRLSYFKKPVCPGCLAYKPLDEVNVSADHHNFEEGGPTAWACLSCSEWVVNQENDEQNRPDVVKGALRTAERITDLLARVTEPPEDVNMNSGRLVSQDSQGYSRTMNPGFLSTIMEFDDGDVEMEDV